MTGRAFEFATVLEVTDGGPDGFLLRVPSGRRRHPHTLVVAADERSLALDHSVGEPLHDDDVGLWAHWVVTWLTEQLDTGVLRWGQRITLSDGAVAIDPRLEPEPSNPWEISPVPLGRPTRAGQRQLQRLVRDGQSRHVVIDQAPTGVVYYCADPISERRVSSIVRST